MTSQRTRQRTTGAATILSMVAWMLSSNVTPADCFAQTAATAFTATPTSSTKQQHQNVVDRTMRSTALHFRDTPSSVEGIAAFTPTTSSSSPPLDTIVRPSTTTTTTSVSNSPLDDDGHLPTWLSIPRSHLSEHNMERLGDAMRRSFFTQTEVLKLQNAIQEASGGDAEKIAGAADFLLILVETMEMGYNALVAAAFHYCACVMARERHESTLLEHSQTESFGEHVVGITRDAARLKHLENVAAAVMDSEGVARVSPDSHDAENIRNLLLSETNDWRALAIRSAACLYRLRGLLQSEDMTTNAQQQLTQEGARVAREALYIYAPLASRLGMNRLKNELEGAAFRILYRRQYEKVKQLTQEHCKSDDSTSIGQSMRRVLDQVKDDMTVMLQDNEEFSSLVNNLSVTARVKESYSMWRKMLRNGHKHILDVPDALALRIVFDAKQLTDDEPRQVTRARERALCYYAQQLCTERWQPMEGDARYKDYIDRPKANGYQSLHYTAKTAYAGDDWNLEIQVRSSEMHQVAEFGLASHWDYKAQKKTTTTTEPSSPSSPTVSPVAADEFDRSSEAYLRKVEQWHWQQHAGASSSSSPGEDEAKKKAAFVTASLNDASPATVEPVVLSDIWQSRVRADRIRARTQRLEPYIQALTTAQSDLARDYVFVFLKQHDESQSAEGKVLALPAGACVVDALRQGERSLGVPMLVGDKFDLNGAATSMTSRLSNGDVLTVPLQTSVTVSA